MDRLKCYIQNHFALFLFIAVASYILTLILGGLWVWLPFAMFVPVGFLLCISLQSLWDKLFSGICLICLCYIAFPKLLESEWFYNLVDRIFSGLKYSVYKSAFAENFGALLGSAIAIIGALWTQNHFNEEEKKQSEIRDMRAVYYDLKYAVNETHQIIQNIVNASGLESAPTPECYSKTIHDHLIFSAQFDGIPIGISTFKADIHAYRILMAEDWIKIVSALPDTFEEEEREHIYYIYGQINHINKAIDAYTNSLDIFFLSAVYHRMYNLLIIAKNYNGSELLNTTHKVEDERGLYSSVMNKLENALK